MFNRMYKLVKVSLSMWGVVSLPIFTTLVQGEALNSGPRNLNNCVHGFSWQRSRDRRRIRHATGSPYTNRHKNSWHAAFHKVVHRHTSERWATVAIFLNIHFSIYIPKLKQNTLAKLLQTSNGLFIYYYFQHAADRCTNKPNSNSCMTAYTQDMEQSASCCQRLAVAAVFPSAFKVISVSIVIRLLTVSPVLSQRFSHRLCKVPL